MGRENTGEIFFTGINHATSLQEVWANLRKKKVHILTIMVLDSKQTFSYKNSPKYQPCLHFIKTWVSTKKKKINTRINGNFNIDVVCSYQDDDDGCPIILQELSALRKKKLAKREAT